MQIHIRLYRSVPYNVLKGAGKEREEREREREREREGKIDDRVG